MDDFENGKDAPVREGETVDGFEEKHEDFCADTPPDHPEPFSFFDAVYGVFFSPRETFRKIGEKRPVLTSAVLVCALSVINFLAGIGGMKSSVFHGHHTPPFEALEAGVAVMAVLVAVVSLFVWFLFSASISLFSQMLGGAGNGLGLLSVLSFAQVPELILVPFRFLLQRFSSGWILMAPVGLAGFIWVLVLNIMAVKEVEGLSTGRAVLAYFLLHEPITLSKALGGVFILVGIYLSSRR